MKWICLILRDGKNSNSRDVMGICKCIYIYIFKFNYIYTYACVYFYYIVVLNIVVTKIFIMIYIWNVKSHGRIQLEMISGCVRTLLIYLHKLPSYTMTNRGKLGCLIFRQTQVEL